MHTVAVAVTSLMCILLGHRVLSTLLRCSLFGWQLVWLLYDWYNYYTCSEWCDVLRPLTSVALIVRCSFYGMLKVIDIIDAHCYVILASSPGHSQLSNVARWKARGPGTQRHVSDVSHKTDLESTLLRVGTFFVLWLIYRHFVAFLNYSLVEGKIRDYPKRISKSGSR